eukprot:365334-Chlamydomonas_euryale.AAC.12
MLDDSLARGRSGLACAGVSRRVGSGTGASTPRPPPPKPPGPSAAPPSGAAPRVADERGSQVMRVDGGGASSARRCRSVP